MRNFALYERLSHDERDELRRRVQVFVAEKFWEGCGGLVVTEEMQVTIAAQACLLVLGFPGEHFERLLTVLVYPSGYFAEDRRHLPGGIVSEELALRLGEAWTGGPVVLSWDDVLESGRDGDDGYNVVFHEFAHVLDMQNVTVDGTPPLPSEEQYRNWREVLAEEYNRHRRRSGWRRTVLDPYGATDEGEFFAVATEAFFERPHGLEREHPRLFELLHSFYNQDPRLWSVRT